MPSHRRLLVALVVTVGWVGGAVGGAPGLAAQAQEGASFELQWPRNDARPWTRWWWPGSAVDEANLTRQLEQFADAGLGGVEVCPIYGARGWEDRYVPFLSARWVELLSHAEREARRLDLGLDLTTGTGWPFGGPTVTAEDASAALVLKRFEPQGMLDEMLGDTPELVVAVSEEGTRVDLTGRVGPDGRLQWASPPGRWRVYAALARREIQKVKRAAPGGEGNVLDPFSVEALGRYLLRFDVALAGPGASPPHAFFHDSFEYYGADWTARMLAEFEARRGYDLRDHVEALFGDAPAETVARVKGDYRETLSDLHLAYVRRWTDWAHGHRSLSRNQAHGAPANLLDLYAAADIPETEVFRGVDEGQMPRLKLASSAAHASGRPLASAEAFTWLGEHFQVPLSLVKEAADWLLLSGVNQLVYHGIPYSPAGAPWPGWQFYASVNLGPEGGLWRDLPELDVYLGRVQSVLRSGEPDEDVLLYYSPHDVWHSAGDLLIPNPVPPAFEEEGLRLWRRGFGWDAVSDALLTGARVEGDRVRLGAGRYGAIVVPRTERMPVETLQRLVGLAEQGAVVLVSGGPPADVPGLASLEARRDALAGTLRSAGRERLVSVSDVEVGLEAAGIRREPMVDRGIRLVRRRHARGWHYFLVNRGDATVDAWLPLATPARSVVRLGPLGRAGAGEVPLRPSPGGGVEVRVRLEPAESAVLRTFGSDEVAAPRWPLPEPSGPAEGLDGVWAVRFVEGGPVIPPGFETKRLASWTELGGEEASRFAGAARYTLTFDRPAGEPGDWVLDLGRVCESARVELNGVRLGTLWSRPFRIAVGRALAPGPNRLEIEVTNLAANRIRDLDRRRVPWKVFHDINVVGVDYEPLDASAWPLRDSGLLGPVTLQPVSTDR